jgi:hypothetical protein
MFRYLTILLSRNTREPKIPRRILHESQLNPVALTPASSWCIESFHSFYALEPLQAIERQLTQHQRGAILKLHRLLSSSLSHSMKTDRRHETAQSESRRTSSLSRWKLTWN